MPGPERMPGTPRMPGMRELSPLQSMLASRPSSALRVVAIGAAALVLVGVLWAAFTEAMLVVPGTARVRPATGPVRGFLDDSGVRAVAPQGGRVASIGVVDGQRVAAGDELFRLETDALDERLRRVDAEIPSIEAELALLERTARLTEARLDATDSRVAAELSAARRDYVRDATAQRSAVELASISLREAEAEEARLVSLVDAGAASAADAERARAQVDRARQELERARGGRGGDRRGVLARQRDELVSDTDLELTRLEGRRIALQRDLDRLTIERDAARRDLARATVRAATGGIVSIVGSLAPGDVVQAGQPIVTVVPDGALRVDAAIAVGEIEEIALDMPARIVLTGRDLGPRHVVRGTVRYISSDSETLASPGGTRSHVYLVSIELDPRSAGDLRPGMTGRVEIEIGRRSLLALAFDRVRHALAFD